MKSLTCLTLSYSMLTWLPPASCRTRMFPEAAGSVCLGSSLRNVIHLCPTPNPQNRTLYSTKTARPNCMVTFSVSCPGNVLPPPGSLLTALVFLSCVHLLITACRHISTPIIILKHHCIHHVFLCALILLKKFSFTLCRVKP